MIDKYLKKHVEISMANGERLQGFADSIEEDYLNIIEFGNSQVAIKIDDISFIRMGVILETNIQEVPRYGAQEDYSMPTPSPQDNGPYVAPQFVRSTDK